MEQNSSQNTQHITEKPPQPVLPNKKEMYLHPIHNAHIKVPPRYEASMHGGTLSFHLKRQTQARKFDFKKEHECIMDEVDGATEINNMTFKSLAHILKSSKKTRKLSMDYLA